MQWQLIVNVLEDAITSLALTLGMVFAVIEELVSVGRFSGEEAKDP